MLDGTGAEMARKLGIPWRPDLMRGKSDEAGAYQLRIGRAYFEQGLRLHGGNIRNALMYYHGGPDRKLWGAKTRGYADAVLRRAGGGTPRPAYEALPRRDRAAKEQVYAEMERLAEAAAEPLPLQDARSTPDPLPAGLAAPVADLDPHDDTVDDGSWVGEGRTSDMSDPLRDSLLRGDRIDPQPMASPVVPFRPTLAQDALEMPAVQEKLRAMPGTAGNPGIFVEHAEDRTSTQVVYRDDGGRPRAVAWFPLTGAARSASGGGPIVQVAPELRRQGLATTLYGVARDAGVPVDLLSGSGAMTPAGAALANAWHGRVAAEPLARRMRKRWDADDPVWRVVAADAGAV
ncbi:MAG: hypothetical protein EOP59_18285, partial [Sphingomonadales bacterium]